MMQDNTYLCEKCKEEISNDEVAMTKKLINRGTSRYFCFTCLAEAFEVTETDIRQKALYFKENGCTLFNR